MKRRKHNSVTRLREIRAEALKRQPVTRPMPPLERVRLEAARENLALFDSLKKEPTHGHQ